MHLVTAALAEDHGFCADIHRADDQPDPEKYQQSRGYRILANALWRAQVRPRVQVMPQRFFQSLTVLECDDAEPAKDHDSDDEIDAVHDVKKRRQG